MYKYDIHILLIISTYTFSWNFLKLMRKKEIFNYGWKEDS